jgi:hypothetical protein
VDAFERWASPKHRLTFSRMVHVLFTLFEFVRGSSFKCIHLVLILFSEGIHVLRPFILCLCRVLSFPKSSLITWVYIRFTKSPSNQIYQISKCVHTDWHLVGWFMSYLRYLSLFTYGDVETYLNIETNIFGVETTY